MSTRSAGWRLAKVFDLFHDYLDREHAHARLWVSSGDNARTSPRRASSGSLRMRMSRHAPCSSFEHRQQRERRAQDGKAVGPSTQRLLKGGLVSRIEQEFGLALGDKRLATRPSMVDSQWYIPSPRHSLLKWQQTCQLNSLFHR